jgi:hypothetical protein
MRRGEHKNRHFRQVLSRAFSTDKLDCVKLNHFRDRLSNMQNLEFERKIEAHYVHTIVE